MTDLNGYPKYDPAEERPSLLYSFVIGQPTASIAWACAYHLPTEEEIAAGQYVRRRYQPIPYRWMRWLFGVDE